MQDEEQDGLEPDEELVLPEEDEHDQRRREKQKVDLPERTRGSPLLRRVIVGDVKEKGWRDRDGEQKPDRSKRRVVSREIGGGGREQGPAGGAGASDEVDMHDRVVDDPDGLEELEEGAVPARESRRDASGEVSDGEQELSEVFTRTATGTAGKAAPKLEKRRRKVRVDEEAHWEDRDRSSLWWLGVGVLSVVLVGAALLVVIRRGGFGSSDRDPDEGAQVVPAVPYESLPIAEFVARSAELLPVVRDVLVRSESGEGGAELLRGGEASLRRREAWRERYPRPAPFREQGLHEIHASGNNRFAYLVMTGEREDFSVLEAYFVKDDREDGRMLLDWEATEGYSEVLLDELELLADGRARMMRAHIGLSNFYTDVYPEEAFRCYTLHHDDPGEWIWAYVEREGELDFRLISHMQLQDPLGRARKVTVKIAKDRPGSRANQVEIREWMFGGWIAPPPRELDGGADDGEGGPDS